MNNNYGEPMYEYTARFTNLTEFGAPVEDLLSGKAAPPPSGLRVDIHFEGEVRGKLNGYIKAIDYLNIRADGRMDLDIKGVITTPDGANIAVTAGGVALPQDGSTASRIVENVRLTTAHPDYAWVNAQEFWAVGEGDIANRQVKIHGYLPQ